MAGLAGAHGQADGEVGFAGAGWAEEDDVVAGGDEVQGAQMGDGVAFESAGVVEVELLQGFSCREPGGADAALAAVGLPGGDFALQAGHQVFLVAPVLGPGSLGQPGSGLAQRGRFERSCQVSDLGRRHRGARWWFWWCHPATPPSRSTPSALS